MVQVKRLGKKEILSHWRDLPDDQDIQITPIEAGTKGSSFAQTTIRITGPQKDIDSILGHLKSLLDYESDSSRIQPVYTETTERYKNDEGKLVQGNLTGSWAFYFKAVSRGKGEGKQRKGGRPPKNKQDQSLIEEVKEVDTKVKELKAVNAGLKLRAKTTEEKKPTKYPTEPLYGIATKSTDELGGIEWIFYDPTPGEVVPCTSYEDLISCDKELTILKKKNKAYENLQAVEINFTKSGKISFREV